MVSVLAIDTAAGACSVAATTAGIEVTRCVATERGHAEVLMGLIADAMAAAGLAFADLDLIAVTIGPGSFTGLRVGLAAARGMALATGRPCLGVTTLEALAHSAPWAGDGAVRLAAIDTRRGDLYVQVFAAPGRPLTAPAVLPPARLAAASGAVAVEVVGDGAAAAAAALRAAGCAARDLAVPHPAAGAIAELAARRWVAGERPRAMPEPLYLQAPLLGPQPPAVS